MANENRNELMLIENTVNEIRSMVEQSVAYQSKVSPIFTSISERILAMFDVKEELDAWEPKELLKLLDLAHKAQLQPIEQLTKLVQSVETLYDKSELRYKIEDLNKMVNEIKRVKEDSEETDLDQMDIEDILEYDPDQAEE